MLGKGRPVFGILCLEPAIKYLINTHCREYSQRTHSMPPCVGFQTGVCDATRSAYENRIYSHRLSITFVMERMKACLYGSCKLFEMGNICCYAGRGTRNISGPTNAYICCANSGNQVKLKNIGPAIASGLDTSRTGSAVAELCRSRIEFVLDVSNMKMLKKNAINVLTSKQV